MNKHLIINADDFGISEGVNRGVIEGHLQGIITSASVMINMPFSEAAIRNARDEAPKLGLGLHLNLSLGYPVLPASDVPSLVSRNHVFWDWLHFITSPPESKQIRSEIFAQFNRFTELAGKMPDHLNSHQFVTYILPDAFAAMLELSANYEIPIRSPSHFFNPDVLNDMIDVMASDLLNEPILGYLKRYVKSNRRILSRVRHPRWTSHFEYRFYGKGCNKENLIKILMSLQPAATEIMCHAGYGKDLEGIAEYRVFREKELEILMDPEIIQIVKDQQIKLVNFSQL